MRIEKPPLLNSQFSILNLALAAPALLFLVLFFVWPLIEIARVSFTPSEISRGATPFSVLLDPAHLRVLWFSFWQAALSTALTLLAGIPIAFAFARYRFAGQRLWRALAVVPFVMPTVVVAAAFSALLGPRGALNAALQSALGLDQPPIQLLGTLPMILLAHVFYNVAVVIRLVGGFLSAFDPSIEEAAAGLGANRWQTFRHVSLPMALPSVGAAAALTFLFTFTSFGVVLILGGARFATLEVEIYRQTAQLLRLDVATSLAIVQMAVTLLVGWASARLEARASAPLEARPTRDIRRPAASPAARMLVAGSLAFIGVVLVLPLATLSWRSLNLEGNDPLRYYVALSENVRGSLFFVPPQTAIRNSLIFAAITAALAMLLGLPLGYAIAQGGRPNANGARLARLLDALLLLPLGTSAVTLGLGFLVAFDRPPLDLRRSVVLLPVAHTLIALPFVVRAVLPAIRSFDPRLREAARGLGAGPLQALRYVDLPLLAPPFIAAMIFAFTISLGEFGASLLIARPEYPTMPIVIYRFLGQPGALNYGQALAMSTLLMIVTAVSVMVIERVNERVAAQ
ncbi:MAG: iron ABC transporter permease [Anaerolineae bacterium]|nr:iron ABC transporter permease [Candidatus Roseilinea sp.]MDW8448526.1 iron ABC transporter permease [Anaerolineae bacterium]